VWPFSKKTTIAAIGTLAGATDHHSHILPGVDDGVETMAESLRILDTYEALGVKSLWLTPHIMEDIPNNPQKLQARFAQLAAAYAGSIELHLAAEYMIDNNLHKLLSENSELLPIGTRGKHILVETSYYNAPMKMRETLQLIKSLGYHPLLAHPERYMYLDNAEYTKLHGEGVKFQLNLASLAGGYGPVVKKKALWLLANELYNVAGSDLHSEESIEFITKCKLGKQNMELLKRLLQTQL
jgi:tyrosine-protein phosphatase YwqE